MIDTKNADFRILQVAYQFSRSLSGFYLAKVKISKICPEYVWPCLGPKSVRNVASGMRNLAIIPYYILSSTFSLPEGLRFKLGLTLFQVISTGETIGC